MKKIYLIHGWQSSPEDGFFPWLKKELGSRGFEVIALSMPDPNYPKIETWVPYLQKQIKDPDENTFILAHSIGCQAILRYLETLNKDQKIGGVVLLAGWLHLKNKAREVDENLKIARPWLDTPIDWEKIKLHCNKFVAIASDNDPIVPLSDLEIFAEKLSAKTLIEKNQSHFEDALELPSALEAIWEIAD
ncbi:MAG: alpha/beta hydrolase [Candidatus Zambryskibacteria bacterium]|nr:alpha/beta hydrolase [Candidatus Zambryskibacteria bacterium]